VFPKYYRGFQERFTEEGMKKKKRSKAESECDVCYAAHDDEIHAATLRVRAWFGKQVTHDFEDDAVMSGD
jgi:hypothetical protein